MTALYFRTSPGRSLQTVHEFHLMRNLNFVTVCDFTASWKGSLRTHIKTIHEREISPCLQCDLRFKDPSSLSRHIRVIHKGITFQCSKCDYEAKERFKLQTHIKTIHSPEKKVESSETTATEEDSKSGLTLKTE